MVAVWKSPLLVTFLDGPNNTLMYLWNLERMRNMHTMISAMDIKNRDETEELNAELQSARSQVRELQDRVRRMEMLFLQGAAGVASSTDEDVAALRSLSLGNIGEPRGSLRSGNSSDTEDKSSTGGYMEDHIPFADDLTILKSPMDAEEVVTVLNLSKNIADIVEHANALAIMPGIVPDGNKSSRQTGRSLSVDALKRAISADAIASKRPDKTLAMSMYLQETVDFSNKVLKDPFRLNSNSSRSESSPVASPHVNRRSRASMGSCVDDAPPPPSVPIEKVEAASVVSEILNCPVGDSATDTVGGWGQRLFGRFEEVIKALQPSQEAIDSRLAIYQYLRGVVWNVLGVEIFPVGSFVGRVFLLEGDLDMTVILPKSIESNTWFVKLNEVLCMAAMGLAGTNKSEKQPFLRMQVNNISFINAEVKIIKATINNISVDISANQIGAVYAQAFVEQVDNFCIYSF